MASPSTASTVHPLLLPLVLPVAQAHMGRKETKRPWQPARPLSRAQSGHDRLSQNLRLSCVPQLRHRNQTEAGEKGAKPKRCKREFLSKHTCIYARY